MDKSLEKNMTNDNIGDDDPEEGDYEEDEEDDDYYYYSFNDIDDQGEDSVQLNNNEDPEYAPYECLNRVEAEHFLTETYIDPLVKEFILDAAIAKQLLHSFKWNLLELQSLLNSTDGSLILSRVKSHPVAPKTTKNQLFCDVCATWQNVKSFAAIGQCSHFYCKQCWDLHFSHQIADQSMSTSLSCMSIDCKTFAPENFVLGQLSDQNVVEKYLALAFHDYIRANPQLRTCPGQNCAIVIRALKPPAAKRCVCTACQIEFCFKCAGSYHSPTDCETIKRWLTKCADDSETANYISAHTKDVSLLYELSEILFIVIFWDLVSKM